MEESTVSSGIQWIRSCFNPARSVARPTLMAMEALLRATRPAAERPPATPPVTGPVMVGLSELPDLGEVGGVARFDSAAGGAVSIARVGRTSFVGFRLDAAGLEEVKVEYDGEASRIVIGGGPEPAQPA